jgi:hypothetical protein
VLAPFALGAERAWAARHGVRVHYTSIAPQGGLEGNAFLPVAPSAVRIEPHPDVACRAFSRITLTAQLPRGPLRRVILVASVPPAGGKSSLAEKGCGQAVIETTLEDNTLLRGGQGVVEITHMPSASQPTIEGRFSQTTPRDGVPVTLDGTFSVASPQKHPE